MSGYLIAGLALSSVCLLFYFFLSWKQKRKVDLGEGIGIIASCTGISGGIKVIVLGTTGGYAQYVTSEAGKIQAAKFPEEDLIILLFGCVALIWTGVQFLFELLDKVSKNEVPKTPIQS